MSEIRGVKVNRRIEKGYEVTTYSNLNFSVDCTPTSKMTVERLIHQGVSLEDAAFILSEVESLKPAL